jgi:hypothetical protein
MNLLNRYLQAVARLLPKGRRDDIVAELRANILSQMEDREEMLKRPLTEDEQAEILRHHGNPTIIAGRYREDNLGLAFGRQLIGPELFPFYKMSLTVNLVITVVILAGLIPAIAQMTGGAIVLSRALIPLVTQFVIVTLIFIALERNKAHVLDKWDPRKLPVVKANPDEGPTASNIFTFIITALGTLWVALTPQWPYLLLGPGALYLPQLELKFWPQWPAFYWTILVLLCTQLVVQFFGVFRWLPSRKARIADAILRTAGIAVAVLLLLKGPNYVTSKYPEVAYWANLNFEVCIGGWLAIALWRVGWIAFSLFRERHQMLPARQY